jgi:RNA polymerase sigma-70 factor, ECF subfamily
MMQDTPDSTRFYAPWSSAEHAIDPPRAFAGLYRRYVGFTWRVVGKLGVPSHAIDDVVQEVWLVVHRRLPSFEGRATLESWLFGVSLNVARNQRRSDRRRQRHLPEPPGEDASFNPERIREGQEAWERVERFLYTLDDQRRAIFSHQLIQNCSALETAEAIGVDVLTVYRQVRHLRSSFKRWLRHELDGAAAPVSAPRTPPGALACRARSSAFPLEAPCSGR